MQEQKRLFCTVLENAETLHLENSYEGLFRHIFAPILERFSVPETERRCRMAFYIQGLMAIVTEWVRGDCTDSIAQIIAVMQKCAAWRP